MDIRAMIESGAFEWEGNPPATAADIAALKAAFRVPLPAEYLTLLQVSDGGHAMLSGSTTYVRVWSARAAIESNRDYEIQNWVLGFIAFGDNGGSDVVGFDTRGGEPYPVCAVPFVPMEWSAVMCVAASFGELIGRLLPATQNTTGG